MYANMSSLSVEQLFGVRGYVAVVTGGTSGLGFMISKVIITRTLVVSNARIKLPFLVLGHSITQENTH